MCPSVDWPVSDSGAESAAGAEQLAEADALIWLYETRGDAGDLERALLLLRSHQHDQRLRGSARHACLALLGYALQLRYLHLRARVDIDEAIAASEAALPLADTLPKRISLLVSIGISYMNRYGGSREDADLIEAVRLFTLALAEAPPTDRAHILIHFGAATLRRGDAASVDRALEILQQADELLPLHDVARIDLAAERASAYSERYYRLGVLDDLGSMIDALETALTLATDTRFALAHGGSLASARLRRYEQTRDPSDLARAIALFEWVAAQGQTDLSDYPCCLAELARGLLHRFDQDANNKDRASAIDLQRTAMSHMPHGDPEFVRVAVDLIGLELCRAKRDDGLLDEAIATLEALLARSALGDEVLGPVLVNLGEALRLRHEQRGLRADIDRSVTILDRALAASEVGPNDEVIILCRLGRALTARSSVGGTFNDLGRGIYVLERAAGLADDESPEAPLILMDLASARIRRYERNGQLPDLREAIEDAERAVALLPSGSPMLPGFLMNLANMIAVRYRCLHSPADIEQCIELLDEAADLTPVDAPDRSGHLNNLGLALLQRGKRTGGTDVDRALRVLRDALAAARPGTPDAERCSENVAVALVEQVRRNGISAVPNLDESIELCDGALSVHHGEGKSLSTLGTLADALALRYRILHQDDDLRRAVDTYRECAEPFVRVAPAAGTRVAADWARWAVEREAWDEADAAFGLALAGSETVYRGQLLRRDKEISLGEAGGIRAGAALCATRCEQVDRAVLILERGRARLLDELLELERAELEGLTRDGRVDLVERYQRAASVLQAHALGS